MLMNKVSTEIRNTKDILNNSNKYYLLFGLAFACIGLGSDTVSYVEKNEWFLILLNVISLSLIIISGIGFLIKKTSIQISAVILVYALIVNILISNIYLLTQAAPNWQLFLLRDTIVISIYISLIGMLLKKEHIIFVNLIYATTILIIWILSDSNFVTKHAVFLILLIAGFSYSVYIFKIKLKISIDENSRLQNLIISKNKEVLQKENELISERALRLEETLNYKNKELVSNALKMAQYAEDKKKLSKRLDAIKEKVDMQVETELLDILSDFSTSNNNLNWTEFQKRFEDVHHDFYTNVNKVFPGLTPFERKLAAFIKLGLSSKEISMLTNNATSSIEVSRSRLRKKMNLQTSDNFVSFLSGF